MINSREHAIDVLQEVESYFDNRADVDDGIPNNEMHHLVDVRAVLDWLMGDKS